MEKIKSLTSLRFLFAMCVFVCHLWWLKGTEYEYIYSSLFKEGYLGVSFFFILSGFIISYAYKNNIYIGKTSLKEFYLLRVFRIVPMHIITLALAIPFFIIKNPMDTIDYITKLVSNALMIQSFIPDYHYTYNAASWSLSNEMFFYLLFPFMGIFFEKTKWFSLLALIVIIPTSMALISTGAAEFLYYINPLARLADFGIGMFLYVVYRDLQPVITKKIATMWEMTGITLLIIFVSFHQCVPQIYRYSSYYWLPMSCIVLAFSFNAGYISDLISKKPFVFLGEISFSFYLAHSIVIEYLQIAYTKYNFEIDKIVLSAIALVISISVSILFHYTLERPIYRTLRETYYRRHAIKINSIT